jgi:arabinan endo-1,5-alpha-L-arabinosidase
MYGYTCALSNIPTLKAASMNNRSTLNTGLIAAYKAESNANDSLGLYNGTAVGGLTYTTGKSGNAFSLNGTNALVTLPNNMLSFAGAFSYSAWVRYNVMPSGEVYIVTATNGNGTTVNNGVAFGFVNSILRLTIMNNTSLSVWTCGSFSANTWYHVAVTKTASTAPKFYRDGVLQTTALLSGTNTLNPLYTSGPYPNSLCSIGAYRYNNGSNTYAYSNGLIDEVNIYNKELTQAEITELQTKYYPY